MHLALGAKSSGVFYCVDFHEDSDLNTMGRVGREESHSFPRSKCALVVSQGCSKGCLRKLSLSLCLPDFSSFQDEGGWRVGWEGWWVAAWGGVQPFCLQKDSLSLLGPYVTTRVKNGFFSHSASLKACPVLETALLPSRRRHREKPVFSDRGQKGSREPEFNMDVGTLWLRKPISALFIAKELTWEGGSAPSAGPCYLYGVPSPSWCGSSSWELKYCRMSHLF